MNKEKWRNALAQEFQIHFKNSPDEFGFLISFIDDLLEKQKKELREKIEGMKKDSPTIEQIEDATEDIKQFLLKALTQQKKELREKIERMNVGTLGGSIIIPRKDINQLLK